MSAAARQLARHTVAGRTEAIDDRLRQWMQLLLFDYLAVAGGGVRLPSSAAARRSITTVASPTASLLAPVLGTPGYATVADAALVAGITSHGLEMDDTFEAGSHHPGVVVFSALLPLAAAEGASWDRVLRASIVGYDVMCAAGVLLGADDAYRRGFHPTGVAGGLGAAAAAASLLGLDEDATTMAIALAADMTAGSLEFLSDGTWTKRLNAGNAAVVGLRAARLAAAGFAGPETAIEGRDGFLQQYGRGGGGRELALAFGEGALQTSIKFYPCCRYMHGGIDLLRAVHHERPDVAARASAIEVAVIQAGATLVAEPPERKRIIGTPVDAQFSMPFGAAVAIATGRAGIDQFDDAPAVAQELADLIAKVRCVRDERLEAAFPAQWQAAVRVVLDDGEVIERREDAFRGSPGNPASEAEVRAKAAEMVGAELAAALWARVAGLRPEASLAAQDPAAPLAGLAAG